MSFCLFVKDIMQYRKMMIISAVLFVAGMLAGAYYADELRMFLLSQIAGIQEVSQGLAASPNPELSFFTFIFLNNAIKSLMVIGLGAFLGILPIFFLFVNGMVLGFLIYEASKKGIDLFDFIVKGLLPHGIIEIPAIIIAAGFGMQFGYFVLKGLGELGARDRAERSVQWSVFLKAAGRACIWITVALLVAAVVESTITYYLVQS